MVRSSSGAPALNATEAPVRKMRVTPGGFGIAGSRWSRNWKELMYALCCCPGAARSPTKGVITVFTAHAMSSNAVASTRLSS